MNQPHRSLPVTLMWHAKMEVSTKIWLGSNVLHKLPSILLQLNAGERVLLLAQPTINAALKSQLQSFLKHEDFQVHYLELPDGEQGKSLSALIDIWNCLQQFKFSRQDTIVAVGGGALTDIAGFAAATYLRGIKLVTVPTTLLAQVDAAIGGKTAINLPAGKNLAGSFYFAHATIVDPETLTTLPNRQFKSGLAEVIKYALLENTIAEASEYRAGPKPLLHVLETTKLDRLENDQAMLSGIIMSCIKMKLAVVARDSHESGLRRCLNLGHTLGHALEKVSKFTVTHGEAVAIGVVFAFYISVVRGDIEQMQLERVVALIASAGLPARLSHLGDVGPSSVNELVDALMDAIAQDKKREKQSVKMVLPKTIPGSVDYGSSLKVHELRELLTNFAQAFK